MLLALAAVAGSAAAAEPAFVFAHDVAVESGLELEQVVQLALDKRFAELTPGGVCWLDYDRDGWLDLYATSTVGGNGSRMFRSLGPGEGPLVRFVDATEATGTGRAGAGQGCLAGDYDNDGWPDLFLTFATTSFSRQGNVLLRNRGDGAFDDVTAISGISGDSPVGGQECVAGQTDAAGAWQGNCWSISAVWLDHDLDGDLDLYLANYAEVPFGQCREVGTRGPAFCVGQRNRLWRNDAGRFVEIGGAASVAVNGYPTHGHSMGAVATDLDGDGWTDLYVTNDIDGNALYLNRRDGTFANVAPSLGVDAAGNVIFGDRAFRAGMGVDATDLDDDGDVDLLSTHLWGDYDAVYLGEGAGFRELGPASPALREIALTESRWGGGFVDLDRDGRKDYLVVTGDTNNTKPGPLLLALSRAGGLDVVNPPLWPFGKYSNATWSNHRGAAFADYDNDGDVDVAVATLPWGDAPPATARGPGLRLLRFDFLGDEPEVANPRNVAQSTRWLRLDLVGTDAARDAVGAWIEVKPDGGRTQRMSRSSGGSYASSSDPRLLFALGEASTGLVTVTWPGGAKQAVPFDLGGAQGVDLQVVEDDVRAPSPVAFVGPPTEAAGAVRIAWRGTFATDFAGYRVYEGTGASTDLQAAAQVHAVTERNRTFLDVAVPAGEARWYRVTVVDRGGHESEASAPVLWGEPRDADDGPAPLPAPAAAVVAVAAALAARWARNRGRNPL